MGRPFWGICLLSVAVLLALVVPRVLDAGSVGSASRAPDPPPPPIGSCLAWPAEEVIDCASPHTLEVAGTWSAADPDLPGVNSDGDCGTTALSYLGMRPKVLDPRWQTPVPFFDGTVSIFGGVDGSAVSVRVVRAPKMQRLDGPGWKVCAVGLTSPPSSVVGSIRQLSEKTDRPAIFGHCRKVDEAVSTAGAGILAIEAVPCSGPHGEEIFGQAFAQVYDDPEFEAVPGTAPLTELPTEETIHSQCQQMLKDLLLVDDPTFAGRLAVRSQYLVDRVEVGERGGAANMGGTSVFAECALVTSDGTVLTDSLVGIGTKPLPLR